MFITGCTFGLQVDKPITVTGGELIGGGGGLITEVYCRTSPGSDPTPHGLIISLSHSL